MLPLIQNPSAIGDIDSELAQSLPFSVAKRANILPVKTHDGWLEVWITTNTDPMALDEYRMGADLPVIPLTVDPDRFADGLNRAHEESSMETDRVLEELSPSSLASQLAEKPDLLESEDDAPIIQLVNSIIVQAIRKRASDIHIEPFEKDIVVRFRVDGVLHSILRPPKPVQAPLMSRIKLMAGLNIAEQRLPQDGGMRVQIAQKEVDVRVSVLPISHGERLVLRILDKGEHLTDLSALGLTKRQSAWMLERLGKSHGLILATGPTGSGKTTSLYAALNHINTTDKNILTIEDPIEYSLAGVGQIQVNPKIGLTFAGGLRSILRQDPDVVMVGEIRDEETADIAIHASLTGHLVFSTLHTNDSVGAITRLIDMGIEPFLVSSALDGVIAQRLVRCLCTHCKTTHTVPHSVLERRNISPEIAGDGTFFKPVGCNHCMGTGYRGRTAVFEMLTLSDPVRDLIDRRAPSHQIWKEAKNQGNDSLQEDGIRRAAQGITSLEEVFRVTQTNQSVD
ncbi:MAG: type II secretion system ATPase GspE [Magnetococcales bacterium]|nr:type II secretion system ATPase GspE [Magnetococcales bacterium]